MKTYLSGYAGIFFAVMLSVSVMFVSVSAAENVDSLNESKEIASAELDELEQQLAQVLIAVDEVECGIVEKRLQQEELELEYDRAAARLRAQYEEMKLRIQYMYENSFGGVAGMLLSSENPAQLLNRTEYIQNISEYDRRRLEEYAQLAESVQQIQKQLEEEIANQENLQNELLARQEELNELIAEKQEELGDINGKILTAMEAAKREREEQQRRAAEAASRAQEIERQRKEEQASRETASREAASRAEAASREAASKEAASKEALKAEEASRGAASKAEAASKEAASREAASKAEETPGETASGAAIKTEETVQPTEKETEAAVPTEGTTERVTEAVNEEKTVSSVQDKSETATEPESETPEETTSETSTEASAEVPAETETADVESEETQAQQGGTAETVVALAYQLIGTPYRAGGTTPEGFDCSGFTYYLYSQVGVSLSRTSSGQAFAGTPVASIEEALPGDIICYPGHVGLYVGNGQIIHATVPGSTVKLAPVLYSSWQNVVAIRRYW